MPIERGLPRRCYIVNADNRGLDVDPQSNALVMIENEHHHIHEGLAWIVNGVATKNNGEVQDYLIVTQNSNWLVHLRPTLAATNQGYMAIYAAPTASNAGTAYTPTGANQDDVNATTSTWTINPTISNVGTQLLYLMVGDGQSAGGTDARHELVLKRNTTYLLRFASSAASTILNWYVLFYEHAIDEDHT